MKMKMLVVLSVAGLLFSCDVKRGEMVQRTIDSLRSELLVNHNMAETMVEVGTLIDSIDASRHALSTRMVEGVNYESYVARLRDINQYVRRAERKIDALAKTAKKSHDVAYTSALKKLRADLDVRNHEIAALKEQVEMYKNQNDDLIKTVSLTKAELEDKLSQLKMKTDEKDALEEQVKHLLVKSKLDEGDAYYARAVAVEETANRTRFAPKKKKNTMKEALELYKLAQFCGKQEAVAKVTELEKKVNKGSIL